MKPTTLREVLRNVATHYLKKADELPADFEWQDYLEINQDVAAAGLDPIAHYREFGRGEGRICSLPSVEPDPLRFDAARKTVLLVSHDASRTGAPVVALNLIEALSRDSNVVGLLIRPGSLLDRFESAASALHVIPSGATPFYEAALLRRLQERFAFEFAIVNTMESSRLLPALALAGVPTITLVHEFATDCPPAYQAVSRVASWSTEIVYPCQLALEDALHHHRPLATRSVHVVPQCRCVVPSGDDEPGRELERRRIRRIVRPPSQPASTIVVIGVGTVTFCKGVDLFIQTAAEVARLATGRGFRFVWLGAGFDDPREHAQYAVYLTDQIRRAGLEGQVEFAGETSEIDAAYGEADLLVISSRLDPQPGVAWEAMDHGLPVLCFEKSAGTAEFLERWGFGGECVAGYMDPADMARKIVALGEDESLRRRVGSRLRELAATELGMDRYLACLTTIAERARDREHLRSMQENLDVDTILASGAFREDFFLPAQRRVPLEAAVRDYVQGWARGPVPRKALPGFHPGIYRQLNGPAAAESDPLADYLRAGRPAGPWNHQVVVKDSANPLPSMAGERVALHVHAYYPELFQDILARLSGNRLRPDLFVSTGSDESRARILGELRGFDGNVVDVRVVPNVGRDIGPLLTSFGRRICDEYDIVGHVHTKKSLHIARRSVLDLWYSFLMSNLLGNESAPMTDAIVTAIAADRSIGMVFPEDPNVLGWDLNLHEARKLAARLGIDENLPEHFNFPAGGMFWARTGAIAPLVDLGLDWEDYPREPAPLDGTMLHAIERLLPIVAASRSFGIATTNVQSVTR